MTFSQSVSTCFKKYVVFQGRASRSEFWWFLLFTTLATWLFKIVLYAVFNDFSNLMYFFSLNDNFAKQALSPGISLAFLLPSLAVGIRRLHDIGKSGWWHLIALTGIGIIVLMVWFATDTRPEGDKYNQQVGKG